MKAVEHRDREPSKRKGRPTMVDIARLADVDISTVSRALADSPRVTDETKARIRKIVEETGYVVNHGARMLRNRASRQILVMLNNIAATTFPEVVLGIEEAVQQQGFNVLVGSTHNQASREESLSRLLLTGAADGMIVMTGSIPPMVRSLSGYESKVVGVSRMIPNATIGQVNIDNSAAMKTAVTHLLSLGHTRIAHLAGPMTSPTFQARAAGYRQAMQEAGMSDFTQVVTSENFDFRAGAEAMAQVLAKSERPTAVVCASDEMAMNAINVAKSAGLRVPADIAFIGCDDIPFSAVFYPPVSTIHIPRRDMGMIGARILLGNILDNAADGGSIVLPHRLIVRESCGSPGR